MNRSAAFFDLDKTIIAKSSTLAFGKPFYNGGLVSRRAVMKSTYAQFVYLMGGADAEKMDRMREYVETLCTGWNAQQVADIVAETLHDVVDPLVYDEAVALIEEHRAAGRDIVIISSSGEEIVKGVGGMLGADHAIGSTMKIVDGCYTGEIEFYAYGPAKAEAMVELAAAHGYDLAESYAYSDSVTDLPMLEAVGHPTAVNPDRALRKGASEHGWPVLEFARPVSLRSRLGRLPAPSTHVVAGAVVGVGAAALGWRLYTQHRRRSAS